MKKYLLLLSVFTSIYPRFYDDKAYEEKRREREEGLRRGYKRKRERLENNPAYLSYVLHQSSDNSLDMADGIARAIHSRLFKQLYIEKINIARTCKSIDKKLDAPIINQCTILEQRRRANDNPQRGTSEQNFFNNACACYYDIIYKSLTDAELQQLEQGTRSSN